MTLTADPQGPITIGAAQEQAMRTTGYVSSINGKQGAVKLDLSGAGAAATVATAAGLAGLADAVVNARTADLLIDYTRDAPGGSWRRKDGALVVPQNFSSATDPGKLARSLKAFSDASAAYTVTRTSYTPTSTLTGMQQLMTGVGPELYFTPDQEWHLGYQSLYNIGLSRKMPAFMLTPALQRLHGDRTTFVWHDGGLAHFGIATRYRPYNDDPIRSDGTTTQWDMTSAASEHDYYSGGDGTGGRIEWRYAKTARAVMTASFARGDQTIAVDNVDGIDRSWFSLHGLSIPSTLTAAALKVGSLVYVACGMNLNDAHERRDFMVCHIVAINGTTTAGFTATGAGTITLSKPCPVDMNIDRQYWAYDGGTGSHWTYDPSGTYNTESHAIWSVDPSLYCMAPHVGDFDFILSSTATSAPTSWVSFNSCENSSFGHVRGFDNALQVVDHNAVKGGYGRCVEALGTNPSVGSLVNMGMAFDATTSHVRVDEVRSRNYLGAVVQAESYSTVDISKAALIDTHPQRLAHTLGLATRAKGAFLTIGGSQMVVDTLDWTTTDGRLAATTSDGADFKVRHRLTVTLLNPAKRPSIAGPDLAPTCRVRYDGYKNDGTASASYRLDPRQAVPAPVVLPYTKSATVNVNLPQGFIADGTITVPLDTTGLTSLKLKNGLTGGIAAIDFMSGFAVTDASCSSYLVDNPFVGSGSGAFVGVSEGDVFTWPAGNPDGTTFRATVFDASSIPTAIVLDSPLPARLVSGTTVRIGDSFAAGATVKLPQYALQLCSRNGTDSVGGKSSFNLGKLQQEAAGTQSTLTATFDGTVDDASGKAIVLDVQVHPTALNLGAAAPILRSIPVVSGGAGTGAWTSLMTALKALGVVTDASTTVGTAAYAIRTSDSTAVNNSSTFVVSTVLVAALVPNATYKFRAFIQYDCDIAADLKLGFSVPTGATGKWSPNGYQNGVAAAATSATINRAQFDIGTGATIGGIGAGSIITASPEGYVTTDATHSGNIAFRYAQSTAQANDLFIRAGSWLEVTRIA